MNFSDYYYHYYPKWSDWLFGAFSGFMVCSSVFVHVLTIVVISKSRRFQSTTNYFLINLSVLGICSSFCMLFVITNSVWKYLAVPSILCKLVPAVAQVIVCDNQLVLVSISVDRYYTLTQPLSFKITKFQARKMIVVGLIVSLVASCPLVYLLDTSNRRGQRGYVCSVNMTKVDTDKVIWAYLAIEIVVSFVLPSLLLIAAYWKICTFTWTFGRQGVGAKFLQRTSNNIQRSKIKILKILIIISVVDLLSITVITAVKLWQFFSPDSDWNGTSIVMNISFYNMLSYPLIYLTFNSNFRKGFKEILCWSKRHYYRTQAYSVTTITAIAKRNYISNYNSSDTQIADFKQQPKSHLFEFPTKVPPNDYDDSYAINYFDNVIYSDNDLKLLDKSDPTNRSSLMKY